MLRNDILALLKELKLHGLRGAYDEMLEHGRRSGATLERFLLDLLKAEQAERRVRSIRYRLGIARFPVSKDLDGFDFQDSHVGEARIRDLYQGGFMESWINVVFVGGTGTGKTHLSIAIGSNAVRNGARVRFFNLVDEGKRLHFSAGVQGAAAPGFFRLAGGIAVRLL